MARGNGGMAIFLDDRDYRQFTFLLGEVVDDYRLECLGYTAMSNHYHCILRPKRRNLSYAMQKLNGEYAKWWNRRHSRVGHTFQGRFKDQIVQGDDYLMTLMRYVARNPLRAGLVDDLSKWSCGSYRSLAGLDACLPFLSSDAVLKEFGNGDVATLQSRFTKFVLGERFSAAIEDRIRSTDRVIGGRLFKRAILGRPQDKWIESEEVSPSDTAAGSGSMTCSLT